MKENLGFTMLEAVIVMAVMAGLTIAVPAFYYWFKGQGVGLAVHQLSAELQQARIMAINRRQSCAVLFHSPRPQQYVNSLNNRMVCLSGYRGDVRFLASGPDGRASAARIAFNRQGMSASAVPMDVFLADGRMRSIYRVRVSGPGGIQIHRWGGGEWR